MFDGLSYSFISVMFDGVHLVSRVSLFLLLAIHLLELMFNRVHLHPDPFLLLAIHLLELMYKCNV